MRKNIFFFIFLASIFISYVTYSEYVLKAKIDHLNKRINNIELNCARNYMKINSQINKLNNNIKRLNKAIKSFKTEINTLNKKYNDEVESLVKFIQKINRNINYQTARVIAKNIIRYSKKYDVPKEIIISVIWTESHFNPLAYNSKSGCIGLMQINPKIWLRDAYNAKVLLFDIPTNIDIGAYILKYYYNKYKSWDKALYAYYGFDNNGIKYKKLVMKRICCVRKQL